MKNLFKYFKGNILETILGPLFKLFEALFELVVPLVICKIVDDAIPANDSGLIFRMVGLLILLGAVGLIFSITAQYFSAKVATTFAAKVRMELFSHLHKISFTDIDEKGTSRLITGMTSDINQLQTGVNLTLRLFLRSPFVVFGAMIMAFTIDVKSALVFVVAIPALAVVVFGIMLISIPLYKKVQRALERVTVTTRENILGARVIRAFAREEREKKDFAERNDVLDSAQRFVGRISGLLSPLTFLIINFAVIWLIYTGAIRVEAGMLLQGEVLALYNYMSQILVELVKLANLIITMTKAWASGSRVAELLDIPAEKESALLAVYSDDSPVVEFKNVSFTYKGASDSSIENISFMANKGETIGIIGGTGSGKSTLVNLVDKYYPITSGQLLIWGDDINTVPTKELRKRVALVPQASRLFSGTIRDNIKWGNQNATDEEIMSAIESAQAKEVVLGKEKGLDEEILQGGSNLSGGQKQRLCIARALVGKPKVLILDDSASALDFATDARLRLAIRELEWKPTVFIVSQRAASVMHCDKILVLDDGQCVGIGTSEQLLKKCDVYREIYYSQFPEEEEVAQ